MTDWYYESDQRVVGPVTRGTLERMVTAGVVRPDGLVWSDGLADWTEARVVLGIQQRAAGDRQGFAIGDPRAMPRAALAGFWVRFGASFIDGLCIVATVLAAAAVLLALFGRARVHLSDLLVLTELLSLSCWLVVPAFESSSWQATPGKRLLGLRVVGTSGQRIGFGRALLRYLCKIPSHLLLGIGCAMIAWTRHRQGLHDLLAGTYVVRDGQ